MSIVDETPDYVEDLRERAGALVAGGIDVPPLGEVSDPGAWIAIDVLVGFHSAFEITTATVHALAPGDGPLGVFTDPRDAPPFQAEGSTWPRTWTWAFGGRHTGNFNGLSSTGRFVWTVGTTIEFADGRLVRIFDAADLLRQLGAEVAGRATRRR